MTIIILKYTAAQEVLMRMRGIKHRILYRCFGCGLRFVTEQAAIKHLGPRHSHLHFIKEIAYED